jgi:dTDP-4-dehydrorhamnose reductase
MVSAAALVRPAPRPVNSRMRCLLSEATGLPSLPSWQGALEKFVQGDALDAR